MSGSAGWIIAQIQMYSITHTQIQMYSITHTQI